MQTFKFLILLTLVVCAGCVSRPELTRLPGKVPSGFSVDGQWSLVSDSILVNEIPAVPTFQIGPRSSPQVVKDVPGSAAFVFLETGTDLKITQTATGMFISFDRAIVEEYRFGELRSVSVGPIMAQRSTGFPGGVLTIQTADEDGAVMTETYRKAGGDLIREIRITRGDKILYAQSRRYTSVD